MKTTYLGVITIFTVLVVAACSTTTQSTMTPTAGEIATATAMPSVNTRDAVEQASWSDGVTITFDDAGNTFRYQSNGIPSHGFAEQYLIPKDVSSQPFNVTFVQLASKSEKSAKNKSQVTKSKGN